jgi:hypothetical protein
MGFLGIPVFNIFTGHAEGPFSRRHELPTDFKTIFIYRDPAQAMRSRGCFKHFMHMWSETREINRLFKDEVPSAKRFRSEWKLRKDSGHDIFRLKFFFHLWEDYASTRKHDIAFLKYEELATHWGSLLSWLGLPATPLRGFKLSERDVSVLDQEIYRPLSDLQAQRPGFEIIPAENARTVGQNGVRRSLMVSPRTVFRVLPPRAGASDAFSRIGLTYDVLRTITTGTIQLCAYRNYHSPNTDFMRLFKVQEIPGLTVLGDQPLVKPKLKMTTTELVYWLLFDPDHLECGGVIEVEANEYPHARIAQTFKRWFPFQETFQESLNYTPSANPFLSRPGVNVVIHLRRGDISGEALRNSRSRLGRFWRQPAGGLGKGMHSRPLLHLGPAIKDLKRRVPRGTSCNVMIVSDGFERQKRKYWANPLILQRIEHLEKELVAAPPYRGMSLNYIGSVVGDGGNNTVKTLDAFFYSDLIYTASSSFVSLIRNLPNWRGTVVDPIHGRVVTKP